MAETKIEWSEPNDFPDCLNTAHNGFSVDVLVESSNGEHTVGWFDFNQMKWLFLCREAVKVFKWRYFEDATDRWTTQKKKK